jgi:hypothetical protein
MIRGGLRTRLIVDSTRVAIVAALSALDWFEPTIYDSPAGLRRHRPLRYIPKALKWDETVEPNALSISTEDTHSLPRGLGGEVEDNLRMYVDLFVQNDELGWQLAHDVRDIVLGKMPDIGRDMPAIDIYDLRLATPAAFTQVDVEFPLIDRAESEAREWRNRWFMVRFDLVDEYHDEHGGIDAAHAEWTDALSPIWQQVQAAESHP